MGLESEFRTWHKEHPNFMTPHIRQLKAVDNFILELSEGTDFDHNPMFGVSAIKKTEKGFRIVDEIGSFKPNMPFNDISEARNHMKSVESKIKECLKNKDTCEVKII